MGENPCVSDGKQFTYSLMEDADNLLENVDAGIKISRPFISHSATQTPFWKFVVGRDYRELCGRDKEDKEDLSDNTCYKWLCINFKQSTERIWVFFWGKEKKEGSDTKVWERNQHL